MPSPRDGEEPSASGGSGGEDTSLSPIKVTGQALAAVTTAGVGAFVAGAEGTVVGAALSSVVTTVGDAVYQRSLVRTRDRLRTSIGSRRAPVGEPGSGAVDAADPTRAMPADGATRAMPEGDATRAMPGGDPTRAMASPPPPDDSPTRALPAGGEGDDPEGADGGGRPRAPWRRYVLVAATGLLIFLIAMVVVTGIERVKGSPLSGEGEGTSVGSVVGTRAPTLPAETEAPVVPIEPAPGTVDQGPPPETSEQAPTTTEPGAGGQDESPTTNPAPGVGDLVPVPTGLLPGN